MAASDGHAEARISSQARSAHVFPGEAVRREVLEFTFKVPLVIRDSKTVNEARATHLPGFRPVWEHRQLNHQLQPTMRGGILIASRLNRGR